jgi:hypothetical protein
LWLGTTLVQAAVRNQAVKNFDTNKKGKQMKLTTTLSILSVLVGSSAFAAADHEIVPVPVTHVFSPKGFDANDNTEVVISGYLPNLCYKAAKADVKVEGRKIGIRVKAIKSGGPYCPQMIVPFLETAPAGVLDKGDYEVVVNKGLPSEQHSQIFVAESASPAIDDFVYAGVQYVEAVEGTRKVVLKGENPSTCYELDRIDFVSNGRDTYSVLPILKKVAEICPRVMVPFAYEVEVPSDLTAAELLLHVRIMNGKSVNSLFHNE